MFKARLGVGTVVAQVSRFSSTLASLILRPYQEQCIDACATALANGSSRIGVSLPTGSGKTTVFITLLSKLLAPDEAATKSIILVNSVELATQSASQVMRLFPHWSVEIEQGAKYKASGLADVTIATYQTLLNPDRLAKFDAQKLKAVIIDEAHHAAAPSYRKILSHFHPDIKHPDPNFVPSVEPRRIPIVGFSATFSRHDGLALGSIFERIVYHQDFINMIKGEWLCDVRLTSVKASINLKNVTINSRTGDFNPTSLAQVINTKSINDLVVKCWIDRATKRKSTLIFCVNVAHVRALTRTFREYGVDARYVYSLTPASERKALLASFKAGDFPVLINCAILTEGADIPNIDCVVITRPTRSRNVFAQMIGRGMRLSPETGKENCSIIDFVDSTSKTTGVVSVPTLLGLDPLSLDIEDASLESLEKRSEVSGSDSNSNWTPDIPNPNFVTFLEHEDPFTSLLDPNEGNNIWKFSSNAWVRCGNEIYVLECLKWGYVQIERVVTDHGSHFVARYRNPSIDPQTAAVLKISPYISRTRELLKAETLADAMRGCDTYVKENVLKKHGYLGVRRNATWRKLPATESQKKVMERKWLKDTMKEKNKSGVVVDFASNGRLQSMTRGEAADMITRLKRGAYGRYQKQARTIIKSQEDLKKRSLRQGRGMVEVGPLRNFQNGDGMD